MPCVIESSTLSLMLFIIYKRITRSHDASEMVSSRTVSCQFSSELLTRAYIASLFISILAQTATYVVTFGLSTEKEAMSRKIMTLVIERLGRVRFHLSLH